MSKKYGFQSPIYEKPTGKEIVGGIVLDLILAISATALGIKIRNKTKGGKQ